MPRLNLTVLPLLAALAIPAPAIAHAHLKASSPAAKSVLRIAPNVVSIDFTEALEARFCSIEVRDDHGNRVDAGDTHVDPNDARRLFVTLRPLQPGVSSVKWRATATDTHTSDGAFDFSIAP